MKKENTAIPDFYVDSTITISTRHATHSIRTPLLLLLAAAGCICMLISCLSMVQPVYSAVPFWSVTVLAIGLTSALSLLPYQLHLLGWLPVLCSLGTAWYKREELILGGQYFYNAYYCAVHHTETQYFEMESSQPEEIAVTWLLCCCSALLCSLICRSLMRRPNFLVYFILTFIPLEFGLYEGLEMNLPAMLTVVVTWFAVLAIHLAQRRSDTQKTRSVRAGNAASCGLAATALVTAAALIAALIADQFRLTTDPEVLEQRREIRHGIENFQWEDIPSTLTQLGVLLGIAEDPEVRALGTKDSLTYKGADEMRITLSEIPEEGIYLKDYTGSVYDQNCWSVLPDKVWNEEESLCSLLEQYDCSPQILPFMGNLSLYGAEDTASITIEPLIPMSTALMPYAAYASGQGGYPDDTGWSTSDPEETYSYSLSLHQDFRSLVYSPLTEYYLMTSSFNFTDSKTADFFTLLGADTTQDNLTLTARHVPYQNSEDYSTTSLQALLAENYVYRDFVYAYYTGLPENEALAEVFAALPETLVSQAQYGDDWATLLAIRAYLSEQAEYTLSPGRTPSSRDFVNYFLLENGKGYCMHYATAGTLIARYLGIPARYCEGYIMSADMIQEAPENEDGSVTLTLKDSAGHAWCEFYVDGYGWIPFEMTPGYYSFEEIGEQSQQTTTTAETEPFEFQAPSETTETITKPVDPVNPPEQTTTAAPSAGTDPNAPSSGENGMGTAQSGADFSGVLRVLRYIALAVLGLLLLLCILVLPRYITLRRREQAFRQTDTIAAMQQVYGYFMRLLREISLDPGNQQLLDFAEKIEPELDQNHLDGAAAKRLIELALQADPGGVPPSKDEVKDCVRYTKKLAVRISQKSGTLRRWRMMFVRRLI
ncbi:MAG: transglutaminase domain-containing protein [Ruminococcus sp.]|nr:transglutaminase domain-containing protein [Ruminococcus sp.]